MRVLKNLASRAFFRWMTRLLLFYSCTQTVTLSARPIQSMQQNRPQKQKSTAQDTALSTEQSSLQDVKILM